METKQDVRDFRSLQAFSDFVRERGLRMEILQSQGRYTLVGAYDAFNTLIARVGGYTPRKGS